MNRLFLSLLVISVSLLIVSCDDGDNNGKTLNCSDFPDQSTSAYILPYEVGSSFTAFPHAARPNAGGVQFYSIDIGMPIGTPIVASRSGTVVFVREQFVDGDNKPGHENVVIIEHEDGTFARYFHLTNQGSLVDVGDSVLQLERIATSGNTGNSTGPHLHFDIADKNCAFDEPCQTLPVTFRNTQTLDCGLEFGETYTALSF